MDPAPHGYCSRCGARLGAGDGFCSGCGSAARSLASRDDEHMDLLGIAHYVMGAFHFFLCSFGLIYVAIGVAIANGAMPETPKGDDAMPQEMGWIFVAFGAVFVLVGWGMSLLQILAGRALRTRRNYYLPFLVACAICMNFPFGTALGVATLVVLSREGVKARFT